MIYFTADTHFLHNQILAYDSRPYLDMDAMIRDMIQRWNQTVRKTDIVYHVGDFAFGHPRRWAPIVKKLQGRITLIRGNHDLQNGATASRLTVENSALFNDVGDIEQISLGGIPIVICHYPYTCLDGDDRIKDMRPKDNGKWLIHGHTHKRPVVTDRQINVGTMLWGYKPVSQKEICNLIQKDVGPLVLDTQ